MKLGTYFNKRNLLRVLREIPNVVATIIVVGIMVATTVFVVSLYYDYPIAKINPAPEKPTIPIPLSYPPIPGIHLPGTFLYSSMILKANSTIAEGVEVWPTSGYAQQISGNKSAVWTVTVGFQEAVPWQFKSDIEKGGGVLIGGLSGATFFTRNGSLILLSQNPFYFPVAGDYPPTLEIDFYNGTSILHTYGDMKVHVLSASEIQQQKINKTAGALTWALVGFAYIEGVVILRGFWNRRKRKHSILHYGSDRYFHGHREKEYYPDHGEPEQVSKVEKV